MATPSISGLGKTGYDLLRMPTKSPDQMQLFQQLMGGATPGIGKGLNFLSGLAGGGDEAMWGQLEAPALKQFGALQGNIASRFSGMGSGATRSSGFQNTMSSAAGDLAERLQAQRMGLQQNAISQLLGLGSDLLGTNLFENQILERKKPMWQQLLLAGTPGFGQGMGAFGTLGLGKLFGF